MIADRLGSTLRWEYAALLRSAAGRLPRFGPAHPGPRTNHTADQEEKEETQ